MRSNRASKIGPGGVLSCVAYGIVVRPNRPVFSILLLRCMPKAHCTVFHQFLHIYAYGMYPPRNLHPGSLSGGWSAFSLSVCTKDGGNEDTEHPPLCAGGISHRKQSCKQVLLWRLRGSEASRLRATRGKSVYPQRCVDYYGRVQVYAHDTIFHLGRNRTNRGKVRQDLLYHVTFFGVE